MNKISDIRLQAADLTLEEFLGNIQDECDASSLDGMIEVLRSGQGWVKLNELSLLVPAQDYSLRCNIPSSSHCVYLLHGNEMVGFFHETDTLMIDSEHRGKKLGRELVLAAFAQKPWKSPERKATAAGKGAFKCAHQLAKELQALQSARPALSEPLP